MAPFVKTYPDLNGKALKTKQDRELAVWYLARDRSGDGKVALTDLQGFVQEHELMSARNLRSRLKRGAGVFWHLTKRHLYYHSLANVCATLGVKPYKQPMGVPMDAFRGLASLRAHLYATLVERDGKPISRHTIERITGIPKARGNRYDAKAKISKQRNIGVRQYESARQAQLVVQQLNREGQPDECRRAYRLRDGITVAVRLPNSYITNLTIMPRGQLRKVRRSLQGVIEETPPALRRYYDTGQQAAKSQARAEEYYVQTKRNWHGQKVWAWCSA